MSKFGLQLAPVVYQMHSYDRVSLKMIRLKRWNGPKIVYDIFFLNKQTLLNNNEKRKTKGT